MNPTTTLRRTNLATPWPVFVLAPLLIAYLYLCYHPELVLYYGYVIPEAYLRLEYQQVGIVLFSIIVLFETFRFSRKKRHFEQRMAEYQQRVEELLQYKSKLQHKVHKYSDHADKLKLYISDRLLEHIEYDEKFLHFKNIASEVRHNGVICYDKVNTSLREVIEKSADEDKERYQDALNSMAYLWDLLDLSTTDNIAMYIANKLYESEEHYYQQLLSEDASPYSPTFSMRQAVLTTLCGFINNRDDSCLPSLEKSEPHYSFSNGRFVLELDAVGELLGNENYIVLMLENLINNALCYSEIKKYSGPYSRVVVKLLMDDSQAKLTVYNRGPLIKEAARAEIFHLGYSTKRVRENNGKGLGLYFVSEIVKGYEGEINFENVQNKEETYLLRITLANGEEVTSNIVVEVNDKNQPVCRDAEESTQTTSASFKLKSAISHVELLWQSTQQRCIFEALEGKDEVYADRINPDRPAWQIEIRHNKRGSRLIFKPLDVSGVQFNVYLPTAKSRLDSSYHDMASDELEGLEELDKEFEPLREYLD